MRAGFYPLVLPEDLSFVVTDLELRVLSFRIAGDLPLSFPASGVFTPPAALRRAFSSLLEEERGEDLAEIPFRTVAFRRSNREIFSLCTLRELSGITLAVFCFFSGKERELSAPLAAGLPVFPVRRALSALFPVREACRRKRPCRLSGFASLFSSAFSDAAHASGRTLTFLSSFPEDRCAELFSESFAAASAALFSLFFCVTAGDIRAEMKETEEGLALFLSAAAERRFAPFSLAGPLYPARAALGAGAAELLTVDDIAEKSGFLTHLALSEEGTVSASLTAGTSDLGDLGFKAGTEYDNTGAVLLSARHLWLAPPGKPRKKGV